MRAGARVRLGTSVLALGLAAAAAHAGSGDYAIQVSWSAAAGRQVVVRDLRGGVLADGRIPFAMGDAFTVEAGPSATFVGRTESYHAEIGCVREKIRRRQWRCEPYTYSETKRGCLGFCKKTIVHHDWHCFWDTIIDDRRGAVGKDSDVLRVEATTFRNIVPVLVVQRPADPSAAPLPMVLKRTDAGGPGTQFMQVAPTSGFVQFASVDVPAGMFWRQAESPDPAVRDELDRRVEEWMGTLCDNPARDGCLIANRGGYECTSNTPPQLTASSGGDRYELSITVRVRTPVAGGRP